MKSRYQIQMDFDRAYKEASRLDDIAVQLKALANKKMDDSMMKLSSAWTGTNSRFFLQKESGLKENILNTAKELAEVAADIRRIARRVYEAEQLAYSIAAHRSSGS